MQGVLMAAKEVVFDVEKIESRLSSIS
jgi:hypothetical protein